MCRWLHVICFLSSLALLAPPSASGGDSKKSDKSEPTKDRLIPAGVVVGQIISDKVEGGFFKLRIHSKQPEIKWNPQMPRPGDPNSYRNAINSLRGTNANVTLKDSHADVDITLSEEAKIRIPLKPEIDEQTKRVKPESLRPDPKDPDRKLGGLKGTEKDLVKDHWVVVTLGATREKPPRILGTIVQVVGEPKK